MADPCVQCLCPPDSTYENVCCCPPQSGISVYQPGCQRLSAACNGQTVVNNPCYCEDNNTSTWSYKFFTDCTPGSTVSAISNFLIPICADIPSNEVVVEEKVDGCGEFYTVAFTLSTSDGNFGPAPTGFQWLKVENPTPPSPPNIQRYGKGACVEYRISIVGNYPNAAQSIFVKAGQNELEFTGCEDGCFIVPGCAPPGALSVDKNSSVNIINNAATLHYDVLITNTGGQPVSNITYNDVITFDDVNLNLGPVMNLPPELKAVSGFGIITISGTFAGPLLPGGTISVSYDVPITQVVSPNTYTVYNTVTVSAAGTSDSDTLGSNIGAVQLRGQKCCTIENGNEVAFFIRVFTVGSSPSTTVNIFDTMSIPAGITVEFLSFDGCTATFPTNNPVLLNTAYTGGPTTSPITVTCTNLPVPGSGGSVQRAIRLRVLSTSVFNCVNAANIINALQEVNGANTGQVYLTPINVPTSASTNILGCITCGSPCP